MNIVCAICSDLLTPSDDVFHTPCGHIFHYACLIQWLERAKTCPQCREKTTEHKIHRIYFNFSNDSFVEDATSLQNRIDNLNFQLKLRDKNLDNLTEANKKLQEQTTGLRHEIQKIESEMSSKNSAIHAFREQIKFYKQQCSDVDNYRKENEHLKKNLEFLKNVQSIIDSSICNLESIILETSDTCKLQTYIAVLKREMNLMSKRSKEIREKYKKLHEEYTRVSAENKRLTEECTKRKELEDRLMICETEKMSLQTQLLDMQANAYKCISSEASVEKQDSLVAHVRKHNTVEKSNMIMNECESNLEDLLKLKKNDSCIIIDPDSTKDTPHSIKSQGFFSMRDHGMKRQKSSNSLKVPSILVKKSRFNQPNQKTASGSGMSFDGFGGHAKYEKFPNPIPSSHVKKIKEDLRIKKSKLDTGHNQKLNDMLIYNV